MFLLLLLVFLIPSSIWAYTSETLQVRNTIQLGFEYDSNVLKTFSQSDGDGLLRVLFSNRGVWAFSPEGSLRWGYQGGGKKYFAMTEQDTLIQYVEVSPTFRITPTFSVSLTPNFKYQNESDSLDGPATAALDINEDYWSTNPQLSFFWNLPKGFGLGLAGEFTYFQFDPQQNYSFFRERGSVSIRKSLYGPLNMAAQYAYGKQQFEIGNREDREHEASTTFSYVSVPYASVRYTFQDVESSDAQFSNTNHRVTVVFSLPFGRREESEDRLNDEDNTSSLFAFHVIGTVQFRSFPSVFGFTEEGKRFLLTGTEDENFNSLLFKLSYHPIPRFVVEAKYTRYSNELSNQQDNFRRSLVYGGVRLAF